MALSNPMYLSAQTPSSQQLTLIKPGDGDFEPTLTANFPGIEDLNGYSAIQPFLALLRNDTLHFASAYLVEWDTSFSDGQLRKLGISFIQKDSKASDNIAFAPGKLRLVSPAFNVSPEEYMGMKQFLGSLISTMGSRAPFSSANVVSINATVDATIYENGTLIGPDRNHLLIKFQAIEKAEHDEAASVMTLLSSNAENAAIVAELTTDVQAGHVSTARGDSSSLYAFYRGREAQALLNLYQHRGVTGMADLKARARRVANAPQVAISAGQ
jgi:hypothetical protein